MARIINTGDTAAKRRRSHIRSCAEGIRILAGSEYFDEEGMDIAAFIVFNLKGIYKSIDESALAWDDRNYWKKAEALRDKWYWSKKSAETMTDLILNSRWTEVQDHLITLFPHFADVTINQLTRNSDWWVGALAELKREAENETPNQ